MQYLLGNIQAKQGNIVRK